MLGLLGLRIFEATQADIADLGEQHGHRVVRVCGKGSTVVLIPLPPAIGRAIDQAVGTRLFDGPAPLTEFDLSGSVTTPRAASSRSTPAGEQGTMPQPPPSIHRPAAAYLKPRPRPQSRRTCTSSTRSCPKAAMSSVARPGLFNAMEWRRSERSRSSDGRGRVRRVTALARRATLVL